MLSEPFGCLLWCGDLVQCVLRGRRSSGEGKRKFTSLLGDGPSISSDAWGEGWLRAAAAAGAAGQSQGQDGVNRVGCSSFPSFPDWGQPLFGDIGVTSHPPSRYTDLEPVWPSAVRLHE
jgi:hypothetical protein